MKRSNILAMIGAAALTLCTWGSAFAMDRTGTVSFSPMFGGCWFEGDQRLKTSPSYGLALGYSMDEHMGMELGLSYVDSGTRHGHREDVNVFFYHVDGLYHFTALSDKFQPFVAAGIGGMSRDHYINDAASNAFMFNYGGGFEYFIVDRVALRSDVRHIITTNGGFNDLQFTAGLTFLLGGKEAVAEAAPPPPPPPPVRKAEAPAPPPPPPAPKKQEAICIVLNVEFDFDKDTVKPEYRDEIKKVADFLKENPTFKGTIEGGTDAVGTDEYNQDLSIRRAEMVKMSLVDDFGIDRNRLETIGFGRALPVATNLTEEGRQKNRRAVRVYCSSGEDLRPPLAAQKCIILKVEFAVGSAKVDPKYDDNFKEMADYMKEHTAYVGTIEGYADVTGSDKLNMDLSIKRAESIKKHLVDNYGIPADRLVTRGIGSMRPINSNESAEGRAANRYGVQVICEPD